MTAKSSTGAYSYSSGDHAKPILNLQGEAEQWCTPGAMGGGSVSRGGDRIGEPLLAGQASQWATPRASMVENGNDSGSAQRLAQGVNPGLKDQARQWPTPNVPDRGAETKDKKRAASGGEDLKTVVENWPTPRAEDSESCGNHPEATDSLTGAIRGFANSADTNSTPPADAMDAPTATAKDSTAWGTPSPNDSKGSAQEGQRRGQLSEHAEVMFPTGLQPETTPNSGEACSAPPPGSPRPSAKRKLNPVFVEWLMGLPLGMTGCGPVGMESYLSARRRRLCSYLQRLVG